ncbi:uncharacterized protein isoform X6 [Leptinotarsa decemlineata]|uniref:uncharacterized protein isoform X6 n=1 Tax=Leptinotarsa decemlineata TaxID=7539 RepID=UPI003D30A893
MDHLIEEASSIRRILPWIKSEQDIVNYLRKIPLDKNHLRIHLTILHFLKLRDREDDADFERLIEDDAREIVSILPGTPYKDIKDQLTVMGNMPNRQEAVIRQLLLPKHELKVLVSEIDVNNVSKEKPKSIFQSVVKKDVHNETNTDIKIRIRKVKGALEVVSRFKQKKVSASSKWDTRPNYVVDIPSTVEENSSLSDSDDLPHSSTHNSSISSPNLVQNLGVEKVAAQCSDSTKPSSINSTMKDNNHEPIPFDLVGYLKEVTQAADEKIISICREARVPLNQRPHVGILNDLLNKVLTNEVIELDSSHDTDEEMSIDEDRAEDTRELESVPSTSSDSRDHNSGLKSVTSTSSDSRGHKSALESVPSTSTDPRVTINTFRPDPSTSWRDLGSHILPIIDPPQAGGLHTNPLNRPLIKPATLTHEPKSSRIEPLMEVESTRKRSAGKNELGVLPNYVMDVNPESHPLDYSKWPLKEVDPDGSSTVKKRKVVDEKLVLRLIEMFPQACPNFIRSVSENRKWSEFDDVVTVILSTENYPLRQQRAPSPPVEVDLEEQLEIVKALLPDADPTYLRCMCETIGNDTERLNEFICTAREAKDYPTMKEYLRKQKLSAQSKQYTTDFSVENFVQLFPEPEKTFTDPKRTVQVDHYTSLYIINFFQNKYDKLPLKVIKNIISENEMRIIDIDRHMAKAALVHVMRSKRKRCHLDAPQNIMVLQELAYLTHKKEIEAFLKEKEQKENTERQNAKENGLMNTCQCCFDEEVMPKDTFNCPKGCMFCRDCIQKSCEVTLGEGKTVYKCLCDCPEEFTLQTLQNVLPPKMFSKLAQKKTLAEIQAAGIEELEMCPFCDFASIPVENDKIFRCFNPDCMKESCRLCKEENHIPYKCDELEKDEELKARLYLENKMSEALIRKCWKCGVGFFKEEGCNKMTCSCGAKMCYLCKKPVTDYSHFNGIGGDKFHLCPLYSDTNEVNRQNVVGAIEAAKADIDPSKLKVDPSANIQQHFNERKKTLPREAHLELVQNVNHFLHRHPHRRGRANIQMPRQRIMPPEEARHNAFQIVQDVPLPERPRNPPPQDPRPMAVQIVQQFLMPRGPRQVPRQGAARGMDIDQVLHHRFNRNHELGRRLIEALAMADVDREMRPRGEREVNH